MKKQIKTVMTALLLAFITLGLFGCSMQKDDNPHMRVDYRSGADGSSYAVYNGDAQEFFEVSEGHVNTVDVAVKKESGTLHIVICKENDAKAIVYEGHDFPVEHFTVTAREPGRYRILVHAEDYIGSYRFSYNLGQ